MASAPGQTKSVLGSGARGYQVQVFRDAVEADLVVFDAAGEQLEHAHGNIAPEDRHQLAAIDHVQALEDPHGALRALRRSVMWPESTGALIHFEHVGQSLPLSVDRCHQSENVHARLTNRQKLHPHRIGFDSASVYFKILSL